MDREIKDELKKRGVNIVYEAIEKNGLYEPITKTIFINSTIDDDIDEENAILHEIAHLMLEHEDCSLNSPTVHLREESKADDYMLEYRCKQYLDSCDDNLPESIDIANFLQSFHLESRLYYRAEQIFKELQGLA